MTTTWKQSLCGCCGDMETCCCGTFCGLCFTYQQAENLGKPGILYCLLSCIFPCIPIFLLRGEAREKYGIEGSTGEDAMTAFCCGPCVQCQTGTEIKERGDSN
ncbi:cornifelin [Lepeophtheirus salmonis]|uniref:Cornifelin homolog Alike [Chrysemys picta] n=1 Tax=Lepeophtheirus salmonis TaxID=72036 RepID=A0A0K2VDA3_LEPSM|nr:cornifelin-like [Lepeophtheirus salmonis]